MKNDLNRDINCNEIIEEATAMIAIFITPHNYVKPQKGKNDPADF